jgi:hypothetical protein
MGSYSQSVIARRPSRLHEFFFRPTPQPSGKRDSPFLEWTGKMTGNNCRYTKVKALAGQQNSVGVTTTSLGIFHPAESRSSAGSAQLCR